MKKFNTLKGIPANLPMINVDTDMIIPKQFLKTIKRSGLGKNLFDEMRFSTDGEEIENFILNQPPWREAKILIAGDNFGCEFIMNLGINPCSTKGAFYNSFIIF